MTNGGSSLKLKKEVVKEKRVYLSRFEKKFFLEKLKNICILHHLYYIIHIKSYIQHTIYLYCIIFI